MSKREHDEDDVEMEEEETPLKPSKYELYRENLQNINEYSIEQFIEFVKLNEQEAFRAIFYLFDALFKAKKSDGFYLAIFDYFPDEVSKNDNPDFEIIPFLSVNVFQIYIKKFKPKIDLKGAIAHVISENNLDLTLFLFHLQPSIVNVSTLSQAIFQSVAFSTDYETISKPFIDILKKVPTIKQHEILTGSISRFFNSFRYQEDLSLAVKKIKFLESISTEKSIDFSQILKLCSTSVLLAFPELLFYFFDEFLQLNPNYKNNSTQMEAINVFMINVARNQMIGVLEHCIKKKISFNITEFHDVFLKSANEFIERWSKYVLRWMESRDKELENGNNDEAKMFSEMIHQDHKEQSDKFERRFKAFFQCLKQNDLVTEGFEEDFNKIVKSAPTLSELGLEYQMKQLDHDEKPKRKKITLCLRCGGKIMT